MPCTFYTADEQDRLTREALNLATAAACEACRLIEKRRLTKYLSAETLRWFDNHKQMDELRQQREEEDERRKAARQSALKKLSLLTAEERRALGLDEKDFR